MSEMKLFEKSEQTLNYFYHLPDEILYKIVAILPKCDLCTLAKVSQRFQRLCSDKQLWKSFLGNRKLTSSEMKMLLTSSFPIEELDLTGSCHQRWATSSISHVTLGKLDLTDYRGQPQWKKWPALDIDYVLYMLRRCRTKELILDTLKWAIKRDVDSELMEAISKYENLEVLSMKGRYFRSASADGIRKLSSGCSRLKEFDLSGCQLSSKVLRVLCDFIPETVEKLVLTQADVKAWDYDDDYGHFVVVGDVVAESFKILFHRAKNLKYFGTPMDYFKMPVTMDRMIQCQSLETIRLLEPDFESPYIVSVLETMAPKLKKIDIVSTASSYMLSEKERASLHGSVQARLEKLRKVFIDIEVEVYDWRMSRVTRPYLPRPLPCPHQEIECNKKHIM